MGKLFKNYTTLFLAIWVFGLGLAISAHASKINSNKISASTELTSITNYTLEKLTDSIMHVNPANQNGFASNQHHGIITLTLDKPYDITAFKLWNSFIIGEDGVKSFELYFYDENGQQIAHHPLYNTTPGKVDANTYNFAPVKNVKQVNLQINDVVVMFGWTEIKIREIAFEGTVTAKTPNLPPLWFLLGGAFVLVMGALLLLGNRRSKSQKPSPKSPMPQAMSVSDEGAEGADNDRDPAFLMAQARMRQQFNGELEEENEGIIFPNSPLVATAVISPSAGLLPTPGAVAPTIPPNQLVPDGLQNLTGDFVHLQKAYHATGRIGFAQDGVPDGNDKSFGTGFLISPTQVMTNRHVYESRKNELTGNSPDIGGIEFIAEKDNGETDFIPFNGEVPVFIKNLDIVIFTLVQASKRTPLKLARVDKPLHDRDVIVIGYPHPHPITERVLSVVEKNPIFAVKRVSQGKIFKHASDDKDPYGIETYVETTISSTGKISAICHNSPTLSGNSGSPVLDAKSGALLGVHFKGLRFLNPEDNANLAMTIENILKNRE